MFKKKNQDFERWYIEKWFLMEYLNYIKNLGIY